MSGLGFKGKLSLLVIVLLPLLVGLGCWQLSRYQQKRALEQHLAQRANLPALSLEQLAQYDDPLFLPLKVTGRFVNDLYFLLANQTFRGQAGYELIMPLITDQGQWLLVNRGWLPTQDSRHVPGLLDRHYSVLGTVYQPLGKPFLLQEDRWPAGWPKVIQAVDLPRMAQALQQTIPAIILVLAAEQPAALPYRSARVAKVTVSSGKHFGYALQWFAMALVLLGGYGYCLRKYAQAVSHDK